MIFTTYITYTRYRNLLKEKNACVSVTQFEEPHPFKLKSIDNVKSFIDGSLCQKLML